jgi:hypothetical protein
MTFRFMDAHRERWAIGRMARVLEVSASGYYAWKRRKPSTRSESDRTLVENIREIQKRHRRRYGSPRVHKELASKGIKVEGECMTNDFARSARTLYPNRRTSEACTLLPGPANL